MSGRKVGVSHIIATVFILLMVTFATTVYTIAVSRVIEVTENIEESIAKKVEVSETEVAALRALYKVVDNILNVTIYNESPTTVNVVALVVTYAMNNSTHTKLAYVNLTLPPLTNKTVSLQLPKGASVTNVKVITAEGHSFYALPIEVIKLFRVRVELLATPKTNWEYIASFPESPYIYRDYLVTGHTNKFRAIQLRDGSIIVAAMYIDEDRYLHVYVYSSKVGEWLEIEYPRILLWWRGRVLLPVDIYVEQGERDDEFVLYLTYFYGVIYYSFWRDTMMFYGKILIYRVVISSDLTSRSGWNYIYVWTLLYEVEYRRLRWRHVSAADFVKHCIMLYTYEDNIYVAVPIVYYTEDFTYKVVNIVIVDVAKREPVAYAPIYIEDCKDYTLYFVEAVAGPKLYAVIGANKTVVYVDPLTGEYGVLGEIPTEYPVGLAVTEDEEILYLDAFGVLLAGEPMDGWIEWRLAAEPVPTGTDYASNALWLDNEYVYYAPLMFSEYVFRAYFYDLYETAVS